ncbi:hypothetical protein [Deinococcus maricopensis]|uniref:Uncharacterized protein n=1 Tax=Deinococcus maricopensis (strain DSM 21211 / LMG 22137 / NRRL B-23946 / LB-34) TaxID=709986 RepID=E8U870_DEIML|nr:hypothetical protein [Deinococcus maricopensis]ADV67259.1 hypothetical protein Deima_1610 [Deinococcus maricopensis DSM 21211]
MVHPTPLYRHGDTLVAPTTGVPEGATRRADLHLSPAPHPGAGPHIQELGAAHLFEHGGALYLQVTAPHATLVDAHHRSMRLPGGTYHVWTQRADPTARPHVLLD